jgi:hypothetical protein
MENIFFLSVSSVNCKSDEIVIFPSALLAVATIQNFNNFSKLLKRIGCFFKFHLVVGVEEYIVNGPLV